MANKSLDELAEEIRELLGVSPPTTSTPEERRERWKRQWKANKWGTTCGVCGRSLQPTDAVWRLRTGPERYPNYTLHCTECAPKGYVRNPELYPYAKPYCVEDVGRLVGGPCDTCGRRVVQYPSFRNLWTFCCERCSWTYYNKGLAEERRADRQKLSAACGEFFEATRSDATTCSPKCRTRLYRTRVSERGAPE